MKINQRPVLDSGTAVLRAGEQLELTLSDGPITIKLGGGNSGREPAWDEMKRTLVLDGFNNPAGDVAGVEGGNWSLRVAVYAIGSGPAARVLHWTVT